MYRWLDNSLHNFCEMMDEKRLPHAVLIVGGEGLGVSDLAHEMARQYLCTSDRSKECRCRSCVLMQAFTHPDYKEIKKSSLSIGIDDLRKGIEILESTAGNAHGKVLYINGAGDMTAPAANALLKTLEEPPANSFIILSAKNVECLLPTVVSRTVRFQIEQPSIEELNECTASEVGIPGDYKQELSICGMSPEKAAAMVKDGTDKKIAEALKKLEAAASAPDNIGVLASYLDTSFKDQNLLFGFMYALIKEARYAQISGSNDDLILLKDAPEARKKIMSIDPDDLAGAHKQIMALKGVPGMKTTMVNQLQLFTFFSALLGI